MIIFTKSFKTTDDQVFGSIPEAQLHELEIVLATKSHTSAEVTSFSKLILDKKDIIVDILTTGPNSKPRARSIHGGTKKRTPTKGSTSTPAPVVPPGSPAIPSPDITPAPAANPVA